MLESPFSSKNQLSDRISRTLPKNHLTNTKFKPLTTQLQQKIALSHNMTLSKLHLNKILYQKNDLASYYKKKESFPANLLEKIAITLLTR